MGLDDTDSDSDDEYESLIRRGRRRIAHFTWNGNGQSTTILEKFSDSSYTCSDDDGNDDVDSEDTSSDESCVKTSRRTKIIPKSGKFVVKTKASSTIRRQITKRKNSLDVQNPSVKRRKITQNPKPGLKKNQKKVATGAKPKPIAKKKNSLVAQKPSAKQRKTTGTKTTDRKNNKKKVTPPAKKPKQVAKKKTPAQKPPPKRGKITKTTPKTGPKNNKKKVTTSKKTTTANKSRQIAKKNNSPDDQQPCTSKQAMNRHTVPSPKGQNIKKKTVHRDIVTLVTPRNYAYVNDWLITYKKPPEVDELFAHIAGISLDTAGKLISLFHLGYTIPFLCHYRKELINYMTVSKMHVIKVAYRTALKVKFKTKQFANSLRGNVPDSLCDKIELSRSIDEMNEHYAQYLQELKDKAIAARIKAESLDTAAANMIDGQVIVNLKDFIKCGIPGRDSYDAVYASVKKRICDAMTTDPKIIKVIEDAKKSHPIYLTSEEVTDVTKATGDRNEFSEYFDFKKDIRYIKPHHVFAINRGESLNILNVKVDISLEFERIMRYHAINYLFRKGDRKVFQMREDIIKTCYEEMYIERFVPFIRRTVRERVTEDAHKHRIVRSVIDPGFKNGCT